MKRKKLFTGALLTVVLLSAFVGGGYAIFTDTESVRVTFQAGTIDIDVNGAEGYQTVILNPKDYDDWKPGDEAEWELDIHNKGSNKAWIQVYVYPGGNLWTCEGNPDCRPHYKWDYTGDWNMWVIEPSQKVELDLKVVFPQCAGNDCQGATGELMILVVAKQWRNKYQEYSCIALENKNTTTWMPVLDDGIEGIICYKVDQGKLLVDLNAYGLTEDAYYQLDFTGGDMNNPHDGACTTQDANLAGMVPGDLYSSGYWNWGTYLEATCNPIKGGEGVYNYAGVYGTVQAVGVGGSISYSGSLALPSGSYKGIGAHVKLIGGLPIPGTSWTVILSEMDYLSFTIP